MSKLVVDRDFLEEPLSGLEFAAYLSAMDLCTIHREEYVLCDVTVYYNMCGKFPNRKQKVELNEALYGLMEKGYIVGELIGRGIYLVKCKQSFWVNLSALPHGGAPLEFESVRKIVGSGKSWQDLLRYYLMLVAHMRMGDKCALSRQYFSGKTGISQLTLSKYNTALVELGVLKITHRKNMPSIYLTL